MVKIGLICVVLVTFSCATEDKEPAPVIVAAPATTTPPHVALPNQAVGEEPAVAVATTAKATLSLAVFDDEHLSNCVDIQLTLKKGEGKGMSAEKIVLLLGEDALGWMAGTDSILGSASLSKFSKFLAMLRDKTFEELKATLTEGEEPTTKKERRLQKEKLEEIEKFYSIGWPIPGYEKTIASGDLARLQNCASAQKFELGTCKVSGVDAAFAVEVAWHHYALGSTNNSDKGMKDCLKAGGAWTAPSKDDPDAALERMRQRSRAFREQ